MFSLFAPIYYQTYVIIPEKIKSRFFSLLLWIDMIAGVSGSFDMTLGRIFRREKRNRVCVWGGYRDEKV